MVRERQRGESRAAAVRVGIAFALACAAAGADPWAGRAAAAPTWDAIAEAAEQAAAGPSGDAARQALEVYLTAGVEAPRLWLARARVLRARGDLEGAVAAIERAERGLADGAAASASLDAGLGRAVEAVARDLLRARRDAREALASVAATAMRQQARLAEAGDRTSALYVLDEAYAACAAEGGVEGAGVLVEAWLAVDPGWRSSYLGWRSNHRRLTASAPALQPAAADTIERAALALDGNSLALAETKANQALGQDPLSLRAKLIAAEAAFRRERWAPAATAALAAIDQPKPDDAEARGAHARALAILERTAPPLATFVGERRSAHRRLLALAKSAARRGHAHDARWIEGLAARLGRGEPGAAPPGAAAAPPGAAAAPASRPWGPDIALALPAADGPAGAPAPGAVREAAIPDLAAATRLAVVADADGPSAGAGGRLVAVGPGWLRTARIATGSAPARAASAIADPAVSPGADVAFAATADGARVMTASRGAGAPDPLTLWEVDGSAGARPRAVAWGDAATVTDLALDPEGRWCLAGTAEGVVLRSIAQGAAPRIGPPSLLPLDAPVVHVAVAASGRIAAAATRTGAVHVWEVEGGAAPDEAAPAEGPPATGGGALQAGGEARAEGAAAAGPAGRPGARPGAGAGALPHARKIGAIPGAVEVTALALSPDGGRALTAGADGVLRLWRIEGDAVTFAGRIAGHVLPARALAFSPCGQRILSGADDGTARVFRIAAAASGDDAVALVAAVRLRGPCTAAALAPDGRRFVTADGAEATIWALDPLVGRP